MIEEQDDVLAEIGATLDVEPSGEFAAGVRQRIASDSERRRPWGLWVSAGLTAAVLVIVTMVVRDSRISAPAPTVVAAANRRALEPPVSGPSGGVVRAQKADAARMIGRASTHQVRSQRISAPAEVLVPPGQAEAIRILVAGLNDGTIVPGSLVAPLPDATVALLPAAEIVITPIVLPPFDPRASGYAGGSGGAIK